MKLIIVVMGILLLAGGGYIAYDNGWFSGQEEDEATDDGKSTQPEGTDLDTIPRADGLIQPRAGAARMPLPAHPKGNDGPKVGLVWAGNPLQLLRRPHHPIIRNGIVARIKEKVRPLIHLFRPGFDNLPSRLVPQIKHALRGQHPQQFGLRDTAWMINDYQIDHAIRKGQV